jgi:hypothetical protein
MHCALLLAVLSLSVLLSPLVAAQAAEYTFTTIDVPGSFITVARGIGTTTVNRGHVATAMAG